MKIIKLFVVVIAFVFLFTGFLPSLQADTKDISELKSDALYDGIPAIRLAAGYALVGVYEILGKPISDLDRTITAVSSENDANELKKAVTEAKAGIHIDVCREDRNISDSMGRLTKKELRNKVLYSTSSQVRTEASSALMDLIIKSVGIEFEDYYNFRINYEDTFDEIKLELEKDWATYSIMGLHWQRSNLKELTEEVGRTLGRLYMAEYLITQDSQFVESKLNCS